MKCPICQQEMRQYKEEPCFDRRKQKEYRRTFYRCDADDTWGRYEVPVGPISESALQRIEAQQAS